MSNKVVPIRPQAVSKKSVQARLAEFINNEIGEKKQVEFTISVDGLRDRLNVDNCPRYRDLKQRVLRDGLNRYLESSEYNIYVGEEKIDREVKNLKFTIKHKDVDKDAVVKARRAAFYVVE